MRKEFISKTVEVKQNDCFEMYIIIFEYHRSVSIVFFFFFQRFRSSICWREICFKLHDDTNDIVEQTHS